MRLFVFVILGLAGLLSGGLPAAATVRLTFDIAQPLAVMQALEARDQTPEAVDRIATMPGLVSGITHHQRFNAAISPESWRASFLDALGGQPRADRYGFRNLIENNAAIRANIDYIASDPERFSREVEAIIAPYMPSGMVIEDSTTLVVASSGNGWVREGKSHFDIGGAQGDLDGARNVIAHEAYHLVLNRALRPASLPADQALGRVERILRNGQNEGMATHVVRDKADTGFLSRRNLGFERTNQGRMAVNFRLIDVFLLATFHAPEITPADAGTIIFSGTFTEPGYYAFREMAAEIEKARGRERLVALLAEPTSRFVLEYHEVAGADRPRLSDATLEIVRQLDLRTRAEA